jgi:hypothetical protein
MKSAWPVTVSINSLYDMDLNCSRLTEYLRPSPDTTMYDNGLKYFESSSTLAIVNGIVYFFTTSNTCVVPGMTLFVEGSTFRRQVHFPLLLQGMKNPSCCLSSRCQTYHNCKISTPFHLGLLFDITE